MKLKKQDIQFVELIKEIKKVVFESKSKVKKERNNHLLITYWQMVK